MRSSWDTSAGAVTASVNATQTLVFDAQDTTGDPVEDFVGLSGTGGPTGAAVREWRGTLPIAIRWNAGAIPFFDNHQTSITYRFDSTLRNGAGDVQSGANKAVDLRHTFRVGNDYSFAFTARNINGYQREEVTNLGSGDRTYSLQFTYAPGQTRGMGR